MRAKRAKAANESNPPILEGIVEKRRREEEEVVDPYEEKTRRLDALQNYLRSPNSLDGFILTPLIFGDEPDEPPKPRDPQELALPDYIYDLLVMNPAEQQEQYRQRADYHNTVDASQHHTRDYVEPRVADTASETPQYAPPPPRVVLSGPVPIRSHVGGPPYKEGPPEQRQTALFPVHTILVREQVNHNTNGNKNRNGYQKAPAFTVRGRGNSNATQQQYYVTSRARPQDIIGEEGPTVKQHLQQQQKQMKEKERLSQQNGNNKSPEGGSPSTSSSLSKAYSILQQQPHQPPIQLPPKRQVRRKQEPSPSKQRVRKTTNSRQVGSIPNKAAGAPLPVATYLVQQHQSRTAEERIATATQRYIVTHTPLPAKAPTPVVQRTSPDIICDSAPHQPRTVHVANYDEHQGRNTRAASYEDHPGRNMHNVAYDDHHYGQSSRIVRRSSNDMMLSGDRTGTSRNVQTAQHVYSQQQDLNVVEDPYMNSLVGELTNLSESQLSEQLGLLEADAFAGIPDADAFVAQIQDDEFGQFPQAYPIENEDLLHSLAVMAEDMGSQFDANDFYGGPDPYQQQQPEQQQQQFTKSTPPIQGEPQAVAPNAVPIEPLAEMNIAEKSKENKDQEKRPTSQNGGMKNLLADDISSFFGPNDEPKETTTNNDPFLGQVDERETLSDFPDLLLETENLDDIPTSSGSDKNKDSDISPNGISLVDWLENDNLGAMACNEDDFLQIFCEDDGPLEEPDQELLNACGMLGDKDDVMESSIAPMQSSSSMVIQTTQQDFASIPSTSQSEFIHPQTTQSVFPQSSSSMPTTPTRPAAPCESVQSSPEIQVISMTKKDIPPPQPPQVVHLVKTPSTDKLQEQTRGGRNVPNQSAPVEATTPKTRTPKERKQRSPKTKLTEGEEQEKRNEKVVRMERKRTEDRIQKQKKAEMDAIHKQRLMEEQARKERETVERVFRLQLEQIAAEKQAAEAQQKVAPVSRSRSRASRSQASRQTSRQNSAQRTFSFPKPQMQMQGQTTQQVVQIAQNTELATQQLNQTIQEVAHTHRGGPSLQVERRQINITSQSSQCSAETRVTHAPPPVSQLPPRQAQSEVSTHPVNRIPVSEESPDIIPLPSTLNVDRSAQRITQTSLTSQKSGPKLLSCSQSQSTLEVRRPVQEAPRTTYEAPRPAHEMLKTTQEAIRTTQAAMRNSRETLKINQEAMMTTQKVARQPLETPSTTVAIRPDIEVVEVQKLANPPLVATAVSMVTTTVSNTSSHVVMRPVIRRDNAVPAIPTQVSLAAMDRSSSAAYSRPPTTGNLSQPIMSIARPPTTTTVMTASKSAEGALMAAILDSPTKGPSVQTMRATTPDVVTILDDIPCSSSSFMNQSINTSQASNAPSAIIEALEKPRTPPTYSSLQETIDRVADPTLDQMPCTSKSSVTTEELNVDHIVQDYENYPDELLWGMLEGPFDPFAEIDAHPEMMPESPVYRMLEEPMSPPPAHLEGKELEQFCQDQDLKYDIEHLLALLTDEECEEELSYLETQIDGTEQAVNEFYGGKLALLKGSYLSLVYANAALVDEISRLSNRVIVTTEERKILARRLCHHNRNYIRRLQNAKKRKTENIKKKQEQLQKEAEANVAEIKAKFAKQESQLEAASRAAALKALKQKNGRSSASSAARVLELAKQIAKAKGVLKKSPVKAKPKSKSKAKPKKKTPAPALGKRKADPSPKHELPHQPQKKKAKLPPAVEPKTPALKAPAVQTTPKTSRASKAFKQQIKEPKQIKETRGQAKAAKEKVKEKEAEKDGEKEKKADGEEMPDFYPGQQLTPEEVAKYVRNDFVIRIEDCLAGRTIEQFIADGMAKVPPGTEQEVRRPTRRAAMINFAELSESEPDEPVRPRSRAKSARVTRSSKTSAYSSSTSTTHEDTISPATTTRRSARSFSAAQTKETSEPIEDIVATPTKRVSRARVAQVRAVEETKETTEKETSVQPVETEVKSVPEVIDTPPAALEDPSPTESTPEQNGRRTRARRSMKSRSVSESTNADEVQNDDDDYEPPVPKRRRAARGSTEALRQAALSITPETPATTTRVTRKRRS